MATDATGTPTTLGIPKYNTSNDAPSGLGFNAAMDVIDALIQGRIAKPAGIAAGEVPVWDGSAFVRSSVTRVGPTSLGSGTPDGTKFLRDDGSWQTVTPTPQVQLLYDSGALTAAQPTIDTGVLTIPSWARHLRWVFRTRADKTAALNNTDGPFLRVNNDAASTYRDWTTASGGASTTAVGAWNMNRGAAWAYTVAQLADSWSDHEGKILDAFNTSYRKQFRGFLNGIYDNLYNATAAYPTAGEWPGTAAISQLNFFLANGYKFVAGSRLFVYAVI